MSVDVSLYQRLDEQIASFSDNFCNMIQSALIAEDDDDVGRRPESLVPGELPDIFASKILHNAQTALNLVRELKKNSMHSDVAPLALNSRGVKSALETEADLGERAIRGIKREGKDLLRKMEDHFYKSKYKQGTNAEGMSNELAAWEELFQMMHHGPGIEGEPAASTNPDTQE